jgi:hypothetical protein
MAAWDNKHVEIGRNLSEIINLNDWGSVINNVQISLPEHSLQSGKTLRVHLGKGGDNDTNLFLDHAAPLDNTTGETTLKNDTGVTSASLRHENRVNGSPPCGITGIRTAELLK